ncbi:MAG: hypothetical protein JSV89_01985 [Spirochaetaceae bacterium]|jgi:hypothetical protein|nr:MAG: hypothetical protein JSV89_01985 [Spirochaetaceae bacterium]
MEYYNTTAYWVTVLILYALTIIAGWKVFVKAGKPGWAIIIPIYNIVVLCQVAGKPGWWVILYLIPIVNIVIAIIVAVNLAKAFGKSGAFGFFLLFLFYIIGWFILGYGKAEYQLKSS